MRLNLKTSALQMPASDDVEPRNERWLGNVTVTHIKWAVDVDVVVHDVIARMDADALAPAKRGPLQEAGGVNV